MSGELLDGLGRVCTHSGQVGYVASHVTRDGFKRIEYDCVSCQASGRDREYREGEGGCVFESECLGRDFHGDSFGMTG